VVVQRIVHGKLRSMGRDMWGRFPKKLRWGTAHASVPPIFEEVVLEKYEQKKTEIFVM